MKSIRQFCLALVVVTLVGSTLRADEVVDWNQTLFRAGFVAGSTPLVITRVAAIVQAAVFDAVNGIERRYTPIHVPATGPAGASRDAAAAKAAYTALVALYATPAATTPASPEGHARREACRLDGGHQCPRWQCRRGERRCVGRDGRERDFGVA